MAEKKRVLIFIDWYLPGFRAGGPVRSVAAIVHALNDVAEFSIVTSDRDLGDAKPYEGITADTWTSVGEAQVYYCSPGNQKKETFLRLLRERQPGVVYFNSLFSQNFTLLPLRLVRTAAPQAKIILAPRGMLGEGALKIKRLKKKLFFLLTKSTRLFRDITWHASSAQEEKEIRAVFGTKAKVRIAMNLSLAQLHDLRSRKKQAGEAHFFFLSRISPKKNLDMAIRLLNSIAPGKKARLTIYGPVEDEAYFSLCKQEMEKAPAHVTFRYAGALSHAQFAAALADEHFLFFPTHHENFGHVILESFACACPVILSDQTPWRHLAKKKLGFDIALNDTDQFRKALIAAIDMDQQEYTQWSETAYSFAKNYSGDTAVVEANRRLLTED